MGRLDGKVALVSGGARGLGRAMVEAFAEEGAKVAVCDLREEEGAALAKEIGESALAHALDVTSEQQWAQAVAAVTDAFGKLDVLVNNAGTAEGGAIDQCTLESYRRVTEVNQTGVFLGMRAAVAPMEAAGGGSIINISSIDGITTMPGIISYVASKWAVRGMTKAAARELGGRGIRVNSIHPGHVHTRLAETPGQDRAQVEAMIENYAATYASLGRTGTPREVAMLALFLASDESSYVNGSEMVVDGGFTAGYPGFGGG